MFIDSKMFELHKEDVKLWDESGSQPTVPGVKHCPELHMDVYLGVTWSGPTESIFVAGGSKQSNHPPPASPTSDDDQLSAGN